MDFGVHLELKVVIFMPWDFKKKVVFHKIKVATSIQYWENNLLFLNWKKEGDIAYQEHSEFCFILNGYWLTLSPWTLRDRTK